MSSPKMSSTDLPSDIDPLRAVKAFTVRHDSLKISLRSNLPNIASKLHNNSVIDEDDLAEAMIPYIIASNRTLKLLSTVKDRIRAEPHMFTEFVKILEAEPTLRFQARKLVEKYLEGIQLYVIKYYIVTEYHRVSSTNNLRYTIMVYFCQK